jgi:ferredoxin-nitrate reductase
VVWLRDRLPQRQAGRLFEGDKIAVNEGMLCSKGMNLHYTVMDASDRLLYPQMRYAGIKQATSSPGYHWKEHRHVQSTHRKIGPDSVAFKVANV